MHSLWQNPLPMGKYTVAPVTVYFRSGSKWVPVFKTTLEEALFIYRRGIETNAEFFIFPDLASPIDLEEKIHQSRPIELFPQDVPIIPVEAEDFFDPSDEAASEPLPDSDYELCDSMQASLPPQV